MSLSAREEALAAGLSKCGLRAFASRFGVGEQRLECRVTPAGAELPPNRVVPDPRRDALPWIVDGCA